MTQDEELDEKTPDTATTYERAKPAKASPSGKLDLPKPPPPHTQDELQKQNKAPLDPAAAKRAEQP